MRPLPDGQIEQFRYGVDGRNRSWRHPVRRALPDRPKSCSLRARDVDSGMVAYEATLVRPHAQLLCRTVEDDRVGLSDALTLRNEHCIEGIPDAQSIDSCVLHGRGSVGYNAQT